MRVEPLEPRQLLSAALADGCEAAILRTPGLLLQEVAHGHGNEPPAARKKLAGARDLGGNSLRKARNLGVITDGLAFSDTVSQTDTRDWYRFGLSGQTELTITLGRLSDDADLRLTDARGRTIANSQRPDTQSETISVDLGRGVYHVVVHPFEGAQTVYGLSLTTPQTVKLSNDPSAFNVDLRFADNNLSFSQRQAFEEAAGRWSRMITGDLPEGKAGDYNIDDLLIDVSAPAVDGPGQILGRAGPQYVRGAGFLPIRGIIELDSADVAEMEKDGSLTDVVFHEVAHVMGFGTLWQHFGLLEGAGGRNPQYVGENGVSEYARLLKREAGGVPVENGGGAGTRDGHWRESTFDFELMTGYIDAGINPVSRVTVASMADMGYEVEPGRADGYRLPKKAAKNKAGASASAAALLAVETERPSREVSTLVSTLFGRTPIVRWDSHSRTENELLTGPAGSPLG